MARKVTCRRDRYRMSSRGLRFQRRGYDLGVMRLAVYLLYPKFVTLRLHHLLAYINSRGKVRWKEKVFN